MIYMGDDEKKLKFEEFIQLMLKFKKDLEVFFNLFYIFFIKFS